MPGSLETKRKAPIAIDHTMVREAHGEADLFTRHGALPARIDGTAAFDRSCTTSPSLGDRGLRTADDVPAYMASAGARLTADAPSTRRAVEVARATSCPSAP